MRFGFSFCTRLFATFLLAACSKGAGDAPDASTVDATTSDGASSIDAEPGTLDGATDDAGDAALDASGQDAASDAGTEPDADGPIDCTRTPRDPGTCCFADEDCAGSRCIDPVCSEDGEGISGQRLCCRRAGSRARVERCLTSLSSTHRRSSFSAMPGVSTG